MKDRAGSEGFSVSLKYGGISPFYILEFRSYPFGNEDAYEEFFKNNPHTPRLRTAGETPLVFCPWCGHDLRREIAEVELRKRGFVWILKKWLGFPVSSTN